VNSRSGAGGLFSTETEHVDLGEHRGIHLEGRIQRRTLRLEAGGRRGFRFELSRARPTSVRLSSPAGVEVRRIAPNPDPWIEAAQRLLALGVASLLLPRLLRRRPGIARQRAG